MFPSAAAMQGEGDRIGKGAVAHGINAATAGVGMAASMAIPGAGALFAVLGNQIGQGIGQRVQGGNLASVQESLTRNLFMGQKTFDAGIVDLVAYFQRTRSLALGQLL